MWDAQCEADRRDTQEEHEEVGRLRNLAMEMLQEMSDEAFMAWWEHSIRLGWTTPRHRRTTPARPAASSSPLVKGYRSND